MDDDTQEPSPLEIYTANLIAAGKLHHAPLSACPECGGSALDPDHRCYPEDDDPDPAEHDGGA